MLNKMNISPNRQKLIVCIVLIVVTFAVFWQANQFDFVSDDTAYVAKNIHIQSGITLDGFLWAFSTRYADLWNPLVWLSFMFDYQLHGLNAGGYHLTNVILHLMSCLLLFWLFNRMTGTIWRSAFVAALFALHPLHVESVAWIAERKDVLSAFFWMLTLCLYVYYTEKPVIRRYLPVLLCFACALMSKPMVVTLPIVMILLDYWPLDRLQLQKIMTNIPEAIQSSTSKAKKKNKLKKEALKKNIFPSRVQKLSEPRIGGIIPLWQLWEKLPFFVLSAVLVIITLYNPNTPDVPEATNIKLVSRLVNAPLAFVTYLVKTFWPHNMAILYPFTDQIPLWQVVGATLLILVITSFVIVMANRLPYLFAGWFWYAITIAPVIGIIQISLTAPYAMADRYHYLPSIGLAIMMAWGIPTLIKSEEIRRRLVFPAGIIFLAILSFLSWNQCGCWKDSINLWSHALMVTKDKYLMYYNRGFAYHDLGQYQRAIEDFNEAIRLKPDYATAYTGRGVVSGELGQYQRAIEDFNEAIRLKPDYTKAYTNRGFTYGESGQYQLAIEDYNQAIRLNPNYDTPYYNRGNVYAKLGQYQRAIEDFNEAIRLNQDYAEAYNNRGTTYAKLGRLSIGDYNQAIHLKPDYAEAYTNRGVAYLLYGNDSLGCRDVQKSCALEKCKALEWAKSKGYCR